MAHDDNTKQSFLDMLAKTGNVSLSMRAADIAKRSTIASWRQNDEQFAEAYLDALEDSTDTLEAAAHKRAVEGVSRKRYDKDGNLIAEEMVYSDSLLTLLLKGNRPDKFAERTKSEITNPDGSLKPETSSADAARIAAILAEARRRREAGQDPLFD